MMVTIREYSKMHHISYEAVRSQIARYREDLEDHITVQNRTMLLDDWAVDYLNQKRKEHPVSVVNDDRNAEIEALKAQVEALKATIINLQEQRNETLQKVTQLQEQANNLLETKIKYNMMLEDYSVQKDQLTSALTKAAAAEAVLDEVKRRAETAEAAAREAQQERDEAISEAQRYQRSWFGFYRRV